MALSDAAIPAPAEAPAGTGAGAREAVTGASARQAPPAAALRTVVIGFADALAAPESAWSLLEAGLDVVAFARRGSRPALRRCRELEIVEITAPEENLDAALAELSALLMRSTSLRALMPLDDTAVWLCDALAAGGSEVEVAGPTGRPAALALDKRLQLAAAAAAGLAVPDTQVVETVEQLLAIERLPVALKPARPVAARDGRLARGANHMCGSRAELESAARAWRGSEPLLVQSLLSGHGEGLFGLAGPDGLLALSAHRRLRMMNPAGSGSSACISAPVDPELAAAAERMLTAAGWEGMFMLEFLRDRAGTAWFMELNGRTWGSMALARRLGLEYPAWAIRRLDEPDFTPAVEVAPGVVCRHLGRDLVHLLMVLRGPKSVALTGWPSRRRALADVLCLRRGERWYNWRRGEGRLFVEDTVRTVAAQLGGRGRRAPRRRGRAR